ncbi:hypothetical protein NM688_g4377 [Phlebia brevispora]|uniref:Uncharacterized protein n=1 Tax=Phlebia brevispora TaxID=194682 RepID=A0ACC1T3G8_9APHY|nr:hypothetical protein NM688_g4377 [Phlebia brevispora]
MVNISSGHSGSRSEFLELHALPPVSPTASAEDSEDAAMNSQHTPDDHPLFYDTNDTTPLRGGEALPSKSTGRALLFKLGLSFFLFGLINNVPPSTPKGIIAFCNIFPALVAKVGWPYILKGRIRYARRLIGCCAISVSGMIVVALFEGLYMRLLGICLASFSSGLGELTFLQLSTTYHPPSIGGHSVGYFASGTGAAGLVGASIWWLVRGLGVRTGVGLSAVMPLTIPVAYYFLMPHPEDFASLPLPSDYEEEAVAITSTVPYTPIPTSDVDDDRSADIRAQAEKNVALTVSDKWKLVKPLLPKYMLPLFCVYLGVAPALVYPVPPPEKYWLMSKIIHSIRDYYPLWQLVYQTTVFFSRSSISLGIPPLPTRLLGLPAVVQAVIITVLAVESGVGIFSEDSEGVSFSLVFLLISIEGFCGGLAYVNVFYRINQEHQDVVTTSDPERAKQEREFKIGSIGFADSMGILAASLVAVPTEVELCKAQVSRGKLLCKAL